MLSFRQITTNTLIKRDTGKAAFISDLGPAPNVFGDHTYLYNQ